MNILFLTPRLPFPPIKGDRLRSLYFIKELSRTNAIHLISFIESIDENDHLDVLRQYCERADTVYLPLRKSAMNILANTASEEPFQVAYYRSRMMSRLVKEAVENNGFDLIHISLIRMAPYIENIKNPPVVLDHIDCLSINMERRFRNEKNIFRKKLFEIEYLKMKKYEFMFRYVPSIVTSEKDKEALNDYEKIKVISNGADLEKFIYQDENRTGKDIDLIFVGNMGYFPNIQAVEFFFNGVYPIVKKYKKDTKVYIVGANPAKNIKSLADNKNIFVTGFVEEVRDYLYRSKVFIAPLQSGSGIQNKILEAMACGIPVVSTSIGNAGIRAKDMEEIILADIPEEFAHKIFSLLENKEERERIAKNARYMVERDFSWKNKGMELQKFYEEVISNK